MNGLKEMSTHKIQKCRLELGFPSNSLKSMFQVAGASSCLGLQNALISDCQGVGRCSCMDVGNSSQTVLLVLFEIRIPFLLNFWFVACTTGQVILHHVLSWETFLHFYTNFTASHFKMSRCYCWLLLPLLFSLSSSALVLIISSMWYAEGTFWVICLYPGWNV